MKKLFILGLVLALLSGCATLGLRQDASQAEKWNAYLVDVSIGETFMFVAFDELCIQKQIDATTCALGYEIDNMFDVAYEAATVAVQGYSAGTVNQKAAEEAIRSLAKAYAEAMSKLKTAQTNRQAVKNVKAKALDLKQPAGKK